MSSLPSSTPKENAEPKVRVLKKNKKIALNQENEPKIDLLAIILSILDDGKAEDVLAIDLAGKTSLADTMVIASGRSDRHVGGLAERIASGLKEKGEPTPRIEGLTSCDWVLVDANDVIIHLFRPEVRVFYNLEKLWTGARPQE